MTRWCSGRALDSWSRGRGFDSDRGIIRATTLGKLFTPNVPLFTKQYNLYLARAFMLKAPYCWQRHRVQWTRGYCRAVLQWFTNCIELRYKSSALPFTIKNMPIAVALVNCGSVRCITTSWCGYTVHTCFPVSVSLSSSSTLQGSEARQSTTGRRRLR